MEAYPAFHIRRVATGDHSPAAPTQNSGKPRALRWSNALTLLASGRMPEISAMFCNSENAILQSVITCPECGHASEETMPTDACQWYYECKGCGDLLQPLKGDCCVFCSYGTVPCPPIQLQRDGGCCGPGSGFRE